MTPTIKPKRDYRGHPLFSYGFRPFFLLSAIWAAIAIPLWIASHSLGPGAMTVPAAASLLITVAVSFGGENLVVEGYRTRYAPNALP